MYEELIAGSTAAAWVLDQQTGRKRKDRREQSRLIFFFLREQSRLIRESNLEISSGNHLSGSQACRPVAAHADAFFSFFSPLPFLKFLISENQKEANYHMAHTAQLTPPRLSLLLFPSPLDHTTPLLPSSSRERREERRDARHESACGCGVTRGVVVPAGSSSNTGWRWPLAASEAVEKNQEPRVLPRDLPLPCIRGDSLVPFFLRVFFLG